MRTKVPRSFAGLFVVGALLLTGCPGSDDGGSGGTTAPPTSAGPPTTDAAKAAKAREAVFQQADFPTGFEPVEEVGEGLDLTIIWTDLTRCLGVEGAAADQGSATSKTYLRGLATQAQSTVEYTTTSGADAVTTAMAGPRFMDCANQAFTADLKRNAPEGATPGAVTVATRPVAQRGQKSMGWRINGKVNLAELEVPLFNDFIVIVDDTALIRVLFLNPGSEFPQELEQSLVDKVVSRA